jgi:hypothetical protein
MAKTHGMGDQLWLGGNDLGASTNSLNRIGGGPAPIVMTDITQSAVARQGGLLDGGMDITSYWDPTVAHPVYSALPRTDIIVTYAHTTAIGGASANTVAKQVNYDGNRAQDGGYLMTVNAVANGYGVQWALQATAGKRTDASATAAGSVTALDQGSASPGAFGGVMWIHLFSLGSGTPTIKLQESSDNGADAYADVVGATTGALAAAPTAMRVELGAINVERYIKVVTTGTFTNAVFAVSFVRHRTLVVF